jgi:hypothetical protein
VDRLLGQPSLGGGPSYLFVREILLGLERERGEALCLSFLPSKL